MSQEWYYSLGGQQAGPVSAVELKQLANTGSLSPADLVWREGMGEWAAAAKVKGLFPERPAAGSPPPLPKAMSTPPPRPTASFTDGLTPGMHRQRIAIAGVAGAGMLATFLPWVHAPIIGAVSGTAGDGWITLALFVPAMVLALCGERRRSLVGGFRLAAAIPAGIAALIGLWKIVDFRSRMDGVDTGNPFAEAMVASVQIGIGIYLLIAAGVAIVVVAWALEKPSLR